MFDRGPLWFDPGLSCRREQVFRVGYLASGIRQVVSLVSVDPLLSAVNEYLLSILGKLISGTLVLYPREAWLSLVLRCCASETGFFFLCVCLTGCHVSGERFKG